MAGLPYSTALILGIDNHVGVYLARLLDARGVRVEGVGGSSDGLVELGIADDVAMIEPGAALRAAADGKVDVVFGIAGDHLATLLDDAATTTRIGHVVEAEALRRQPASVALARRIGDLRRDTRRPVFNVILHSHDSRLGPGDSLPARIVDAAYRAAMGGDPQLELIETGPRDWGWTPEYVDAVLRLAALPAVRDAAVATGHRLSVAEFAEHAFGFFGKDAADHVTITGTGSNADAATDTAATALKAATGWSASTWGPDLVRALCEGAATRS